jgi:TatD DNase family protein
LAYAQKEAQKSAFRRQIQMAKKTKKPLVIHSRAAAADTLAILREEDAREVGGVLHSYTDNAEFAFAVMDLGFDNSLSGLLLLQDLPELRAVAKKIPLDRLVIESNAPVNAPPPHRDQRCEPAHLPLIADGLAALIGVDPEELRSKTTENALKKFGLAETGT